MQSRNLSAKVFARRGVHPSSKVTSMDEASYNLYRGDVIDAYAQWPKPDCIMVDGPYGVGGFFGDPRTPSSLADWYQPHVLQWSKAAKLSTTLWFWGTEIGWATVHPVLAENGWEYVQAIHWDKGIGHVAGNVNGSTIRRFPIVNEICVFYSRRMEFPTKDGVMPAREWLLSEWLRTGLPRKRANDACGVKDAATRKYFDQGWLWYPPPPDVMSKLVNYANEHGDPAGRPYYSINGISPVSEAEWSEVRYSWTHQHGISNVWSRPALRDAERIRSTGRRQAPRVHNPTAGMASAHLNQKPLEFMRRILVAATREGDTVWEPFGGLCSASVAAIELARLPFAAEIDNEFANLAEQRLRETAHPVQPELIHSSS